MWTSRKALHKFFYTRTVSLFMQSPAILKNLLWPLPMKWGGWNSGTTMTKCSFTTNCLWLRRTSNASRLTPEVGGGSDLWLDTQTWHTWHSVNNIMSHCVSLGRTTAGSGHRHWDRSHPGFQWTNWNITVSPVHPGQHPSHFFLWRLHVSRHCGRQTELFWSMAINPNGLVAVQRRGNRFLTYAFVVEI